MTRNLTASGDFKKQLNKLVTLGMGKLKSYKNRKWGDSDPVQFNFVDDYESDRVSLASEGNGDIILLIQLEADKHVLHVFSRVRDNSYGKYILDKEVGVVPLSDLNGLEDSILSVLGDKSKWAVAPSLKELKNSISDMLEDSAHYFKINSSASISANSNLDALYQKGVKFVESEVKKKLGLTEKVGLREIKVEMALRVAREDWTVEAVFSHPGFDGSFSFAIEENGGAYFVSLYASARDSSRPRMGSSLFSDKLVGKVKFKTWKEVALSMEDLLMTPKIWRDKSRAHDHRDGGGAEIGALWDILEEYYMGVPEGQSRWEERRF